MVPDYRGICHTIPKRYYETLVFKPSDLWSVMLISFINDF